MLTIKAPSSSIHPIFLTPGPHHHHHPQFPFLISTNSNSTHPRTLKLSCIKDPHPHPDHGPPTPKRKNKRKQTLTDEMLAVELNLEIKKLNSQTLEREEALDKSREILFSHLCDFSGFSSDDFRRRWRRMSHDERCVLASGFVAQWSAHLHPLSARSVKQMVDEYLGLGPAAESDSVSSRFKKFLGFGFPHED